MQINALLRQMFIMLIVTTGLWLWQMLARVLPNAGLIASLVVFVGLIAVGLWYRVKTRRRVWLNAYFLPGSPLHRLLQGGLWMGLVQGVTAVVLGLVLAAALLRSHSLWVWVSFLLAALLLPLLALGISKRLEAHAPTIYRDALSLRLSALFLGVLLWGGLIYQSYHASYPDFRCASLDQAIWYMMSTQQARSEFLLGVLELSSAAEAIRLWFAQRVLPAPITSLWQGLAWCLVLAQEALFVWSYLLLCSGALRLQALRRTTSSNNTGDDDAT